MNKDVNLEMVYNFGDSTQLEYGNQFGYFAKELNRDKIIKFCNEVNFESMMLNNGYNLTVRNSANNGDYFVTLTNLDKSLCIKLKLLDHCVYFDAIAEDWIKIDYDFFNLVQEKWVKFLSKNVLGYKAHYDNTVLLSKQELAYSF